MTYFLFTGHDQLWWVGQRRRVILVAGSNTSERAVNATQAVCQLVNLGLYHRNFFLHALTLEVGLSAEDSDTGGICCNRARFLLWLLRLLQLVETAFNWLFATALPRLQ